jgi:hypothetical protein
MYALTKPHLSPCTQSCQGLPPRQDGGNTISGGPGGQPPRFFGAGAKSSAFGMGGSMGGMGGSMGGMGGMGTFPPGGGMGGYASMQLQQQQMLMGGAGADGVVALHIGGQQPPQQRASWGAPPYSGYA